jgi:hypothetical protein
MEMTFASVAEAVAYLHAHGYDTVLENAGPAKVRIMRGAIGDLAIVRHRGLLDVIVEDDNGFWQDKLDDWASDGAEFMN